MSALAQRLNRNHSTMSGVQKSAVLCMALGAEASGKILKHLTPEEMETVSREIARTPAVPSDVVDGVLSEYREVLRAVASIAEGGVDYARQILEGALGPQRAKSVLERIQEQMVETGLSRLKKASPDILHSVLRGEHPQTIALVLAHLDPRLSAGVIEAMAPDMCADTLYRMARMEKVSPDVLQMVETALGSRSDLTLTQELTASGGPAAVAKVLTNLPSSLEKAMLEAIASRGTEVAEQIRNFMFVFEDLRHIEARAMQRLVADVEVKTLALALKAASDELKQHIMSNMSERAAGTLREEMEVLTRVRVKDVEAAHASILATARGLQEAGEIVLEIGTGDDIIA